MIEVQSSQLTLSTSLAQGGGGSDIDADSMASISLFITDHQTDQRLLKGWMRSEFDGQGEHRMTAGTCWLHSPGIRYTVPDYSDDFEILEIIMPADFDTVDVAPLGQ